TTINETLRQRCIALGVAGDRVMALPDGCAPRAALSKEDARATLGLSDSPLIVHLGVMHKADAALLFEAYRIVLRRLPRARLVLVGPYAGTVPADLRSIVHRTGYVDGPTMQQWLAAADIGVIPFRDTIANRGRWPGKLSEYLAAGLPVAMPAVGSAAELIAGAGAGAVCEPTADRLGSLVADTLLDEAARARMAVEARRLAAGELAWGRIAQRLLSFYDTWSTARV
ncbi:MAG TPA: glycosyltransferase, partial [Longimicrobiales bacterium]|nr:glycosyltransferase [Longimicrobiales bacterium]